MDIETALSKYFKNQAELASVIAEGVITNSARIKANRIWHGKRQPNHDEIPLIYSYTNGGLDANFFAGLTQKKSKKLKN